jgi:hypothetical protein
MLGLSADDLGLVFTAIATALLAVMGGRKGKEILTQREAQPASGGNMMEVAGAIVSDRVAREWIEAVEDLSHNIKLNTEACKQAATNAKDAGDAMEVLTREIIRSK